MADHRSHFSTFSTQFSTVFPHSGGFFYLIGPFFLFSARGFFIRSPASKKKQHILSFLPLSHSRPFRTDFMLKEKRAKRATTPVTHLSPTRPPIYMCVYTRAGMCECVYACKHLCVQTCAGSCRPVCAHPGAGAHHAHKPGRLKQKIFSVPMRRSRQAKSNSGGIYCEERSDEPKVRWK